MRRRRLLHVVVLFASIAVPGHEWSYAQQRPTQWPWVEGRGICYTQPGWCPINGTLPLGVACYCTIPPNTLVYGTVTAHRYWGHVSPYFNPHPPPVPTTIR